MRQRLFLSEIVAIGLAVVTITPYVVLTSSLTLEQATACLQATLVAALANIVAAYSSLDQLTRPIRAFFRGEMEEPRGRSVAALDSARTTVLNLPIIFTLSVLLRYYLSAVAVSAAMPLISTLPWDRSAELAVRTCVGLLVPMIALFFVCERILEPVRREIALRCRGVKGLRDDRVIRIGVRGRLFIAVIIMLAYPPAVLFSLYFPALLQPAEALDGHTVLWMSSAVFSVSLLVAGGVTLQLARSIAEPLTRTARIMEEVGAGNLGTRVDVLTSDETGMLGERFNQMIDQLDESRSRLRALASRDPVTGLLNHRALHERMEAIVARGDPFCLMIADLDAFKLLNDAHGHPTGDQALRAVAAALMVAAGEGGTVARYGGDEFALLLPGVDEAQARRTAQRAREVLDERPYAAPDGTALPLRLSFGIAGFPASARKVNDLVALADANLYESKTRGGDTITAGREQLCDDRSELGSFGVLDGLVTAIDHKDHYTRKHCEDVTELAIALGRRLGLSDESLRVLRLSGLFHDVGKIGVPDRVLRKPGKLDETEYAIIQQHAMLGELIIKGVPNLPDILAAVGSHHEKVDGTGYPRGLKGREIPYLGRLIAVADAYSAMTTDRPYRKAMTSDDALAELERAAGTQLDREMVQAFVALMRGTERQA